MHLLETRASGLAEKRTIMNRGYAHIQNYTHYTHGPACYVFLNDGTIIDVKETDIHGPWMNPIPSTFMVIPNSQQLAV